MNVEIDTDNLKYTFYIRTRCICCQQMFAELQMLTPMVPTREVYFVRYCKQLSAEQWAIVDVSIDKVEENIDASLAKCRKRPSGCIIEDKSNGHCKVLQFAYCHIVFLELQQDCGII